MSDGRPILGDRTTHTRTAAYQHRTSVSFFFAKRAFSSSERLIKASRYWKGVVEPCSSLTATTTCNIKLFQADNVTRFHIRDNDTTHVAPLVTSDVLTIIQITYFVFRSISAFRSMAGLLVHVCLTNVIRYGSHDTVIDVILPCLDR